MSRQGQKPVRKGAFRLPQDPGRGQSSVEKMSDIPPSCHQKTDNLSEMMKIFGNILLARGLHYRERRRCESGGDRKRKNNKKSNNKKKGVHYATRYV
jgi:hypothetical protein